MSGTAAASGRGKVWIVGGLLLLLLLGLGAVAALAPPAALLTPRVAAKIKAATGLDLVVAGAAHYKLLPRFILHLEDVTLSSPSGGEPVVKAAALDAVMPLGVALGGDGNILSVGLTKPVVRLHRDAGSKSNRSPVAGVSPATPEAAAAAALIVESISLADGVVEYRDAASGAAWRLEAVTAQATTDPASGALDGNAKATYGGQPVDGQFAVADGRKLLAGHPTAVKAKLASREVKADFDGTVDPASAEADGTFTLSAPSTKDLAGLLGVGTDTLLGHGAVSLKTKAKARNSGIVMTGVEVELGRSRAVADLDISFAGQRPFAKGAVAWRELDLTAFSPPPAALGATAKEAATASDDGLVIDSAYTSLEAALASLEQGGAQPEAAPSIAAATAKPSQQWSDAPYDLARLSSLDADVGMLADKIRVGGLTLHNGDVGVKLDAGKLALDVKRIDIGKGQASGRIGLDAKSADPRADVDLTMKGIPSEVVLTEIIGRPVLSGPADVQAKLGASGKSIRQIVSTLQGDVRFAFGKGAIEGFDIPQVIKNLLSGWKYDKRYRTPFNRLEGQYLVSSGVAKSEKDAAFDGEAVDIKASGKVSAPARTLEQHLRLSVTEWGLVFPVYLQGRWDDLHGGFDALPWLASPETYANPLLAGGDKAAARARLPAKLRELIERQLAKPAAESKLSEKARAELRELIAPADTAAPAPASSVTPAPADATTPAPAPPQ